MTGIFPRAAAGLLVLLFGVNIYRAATQAVTPDEAMTYLQFASVRWRQFFLVPYDANHHVLHTILVKVTTGILGLSPLILRLPSLAGGAVFFLMLFRLARREFGAGPRLLLAVALIAFNPYLLDFLSCGRGYSLALAFFTSALYFLLRRGPSDDLRAAFLLGLTVAANLSFAPPAAVLVLAAIVLAPSRRRALWRVPLAASVIPALIVAPALLKVPEKVFYLGVDTFREAAVLLFQLSFQPLLKDRPTLLPLRSGLHEAAAAVVLLLLASAAILALRRGPHQAFIATLLAAVFGSIVILFALHYLRGYPFPWGRAALYFTVLLPLLAVACLPANRIAAALLAVPLLLVTLQFATRFHTAHYTDWPEHAGFDQLVDAMRRDHNARGLGNVSAGGDWIFEPALNFYRLAWKLRWLRPVVREHPPFPPHEYYLLWGSRREELSQHKLRVLHAAPFDGAILAVPEAGVPQFNR